jgi:hypothetical protein
MLKTCHAEGLPYLRLAILKKAQKLTGWRRLPAIALVKISAPRNAAAGEEGASVSCSDRAAPVEVIVETDAHDVVGNVGAGAKRREGANRGARWFSRPPSVLFSLLKL